MQSIHIAYWRSFSFFSILLTSCIFNGNQSPIFFPK